MKKKIIILICVIAVALAALAIIFFSHDVSIMTVETNAAHYEYELFHVNPFFKYKMKSTANTQEKFHTIRQDHEDRAMEWYEYVTGHDKNALNSEYRTFQYQFCKIGDCVYYYRWNDVENIYKIDTTNNEIKKCPVTDIGTSHDADLRAQSTQADVNFISCTYIVTQALIDSYPGFAEAVNSVDGYFVSEKTFYENGRIFFVKNDTLYEYVPKTGKVKNITDVTNKDIVYITCK